MFTHEEIDRLFAGMLPGRLFGPSMCKEGEAGSSCGPLFYGYTVAVGPDGKPVASEYGNAAPEQAAGSAREPLVETILDKKEGVLKLVAEMPGVEKKDIRVLVEGGAVEISAESGAKSYQSRVALPCKVARDSTKASYQNGILEVSLGIDEPKGTSVEVQ